MSKLRDFIHQIRDAKTLQQERDIIAKEASDIRDSSSSTKNRVCGIQQYSISNKLLSN